MLLFRKVFIIYILIFTLLYGLFVKNNRHKYNLIEFFIYYTFGVYISLIIGITIFPIPIQPEEIALNIEYNLGLKNNFIPIINTVKNTSLDFKNGIILEPIIQVLGNLILFIPIGFYLPFFRRNICFKKVFFIALSSTILIELTQGIINLIVGYNYRSVDVDDIILNLLGAILGYYLFKFLYPKFRALLDKKD
ncbi:MAG: VanZ family protein [Romboutsia sp.]